MWPDYSDRVLSLGEKWSERGEASARLAHLGKVHFHLLFWLPTIAVGGHLFRVLVVGTLWYAALKSVQLDLSNRVAGGDLGVESLHLLPGLGCFQSL